MARHHKPQILPKPEGKKEQERQRRQQQARQRMRLHTFTALALMIFTRWQDNALILDDLKSLPVNERRYIPMQVARCKRSCEAVVRMLNRSDNWPSPTSAFFTDASNCLQTLLAAVCDEMPETCRAIDIHSVITYIVYAAFYDLQATAYDERQEVRKLISDMQSFADHIIQNDSPLLMPMNRAYWATRNMLHSGAPLKSWDTEKHPSSAAIYLKSQAA